MTLCVEVTENNDTSTLACASSALHAGRDLRLRSRQICAHLHVCQQCMQLHESEWLTATHAAEWNGRRAETAAEARRVQQQSRAAVTARTEARQAHMNHHRKACECKIVILARK